MAKYVALLRGINVGGNNIIKMSDLKACFEVAGFQNVRTYINSGNVLFESPKTSSEKLAARIDGVLTENFSLKIKAVVKSHDELKRIVEKAPKGFGTQPDKYHSDVIFIKPPLTTGEVMNVALTREGVDQVFEGDGVVYFARLSARLVQSRLNRIASTPQYQNMTIRSWSTTVKLLALAET